MYQTIPPELLHPEMFIPAATLLGLLLGSFYNVCIHRYVSGESILFPPSHCPHCNQRLRFWELIPVLSYLLLRGQCARCHKPIHIRYPLVELLSGLTSGLLAWRFGPTLAFPVYLVFTGMLIVASGIDLECFILPDGITLGGTVLAVPAAIFALFSAALWAAGRSSPYFLSSNACAAWTAWGSATSNSCSCSVSCAGPSACR